MPHGHNDQNSGAIWNRKFQKSTSWHPHLRICVWSAPLSVCPHLAWTSENPSSLTQRKTLRLRNMPFTCWAAILSLSGLDANCVCDSLWLSTMVKYRDYQEACQESEKVSFSSVSISVGSISSTWHYAILDGMSIPALNILESKNFRSKLWIGWRWLCSIHSTHQEAPVHLPATKTNPGIHGPHSATCRFCS